MRVAVTGTTGRLGAALVRHLSFPRYEIVPLPRADCDLADRDSLARALDSLECDVFLNPAAITSLEHCEDDPALAMRVNAEAVGEIAAWAEKRGVRVIHFSTDYVFPGNGRTPLHETDEPGPINVYGQSKLAGEAEVLARPGNCVVRISWVFGPEKPSFIDSIFDTALAGKSLAAVADKFSLPVLTTDLAEWTAVLIDSGATGIFHACNSGPPASWLDLARATVEEMVTYGALLQLPEIAASKLSEQPGFRAARPVFTAMATEKLGLLLGHPPRPWREAVGEYVRNRLTAAGRPPAP